MEIDFVLIVSLDFFNKAQANKKGNDWDNDK